MMMTETTVIAGIIGAAGTAIAMVIKSLFSRNQNRKDQQEHEENLLKIVATMNGVNQALDDFKITVNEGFDKVNDSLDEFKAEQREVNVSLLRHNITSAYENFKEEKKIPNIIYESTMGLYDNYKKCGGNGFVRSEIEEMKGWERF